MAEEVREANVEETTQSKEEINKLIQVKRDKLAQLKSESKDPFRLKTYDVNHHCQEFNDQFDQ